MNKKILGTTIAIALMITAAGLAFILSKNNGRASNADGHTVEIFYLPHPPALAVVDRIEPILADFPRFKVKKYDFTDPANIYLIDKYNIKEHMPVAIFIDGRNEFEVNGGKVVLKNFPKEDAFVPDFAGQWSYDDLRQILANIK